MDNEHLSFFGNFSKMQHFKVYSGFTPTLSENTEEYYSKKSKLLHIITYLNLTEKEKTELKNIVKSINGLKISAFMKEMEHTFDISDGDRIYWLIYNLKQKDIIYKLKKTNNLKQKKHGNKKFRNYKGC